MATLPSNHTGGKGPLSDRWASHLTKRTLPHFSYESPAVATLTASPARSAGHFASSNHFQKMMGGGGCAERVASINSPMSQKIRQD